MSKQNNEVSSSSEEQTVKKTTAKDNRKVAPKSSKTKVELSKNVKKIKVTEPKKNSKKPVKKTVSKKEESSSDESSSEEEAPKKPVKKTLSKKEESSSDESSSEEEAPKKPVKKTVSKKEESSSDESSSEEETPKKQVNKKEKNSEEEISNKTEEASFDESSIEEEANRAEISKDERNAEEESSYDEERIFEEKVMADRRNNRKSEFTRLVDNGETYSSQELADENAEESSSDIEQQSSSIDEEQLEDKDARVVFMKGIPFDLSEDDLKKKVNEIGKTVRVSIPVTGDRDRNKGFAFIEFVKEADAKRCLKLNDQELFGRKITVNLASSSERKKKYTLKLNNLPYKCSKEELVAFLEQHGEIKGCHIPMDDEDRCKGFAFVFCEDEDLFKKLMKSKLKFKDRTLFVRDADEQQSGKDKYDIRKKNVVDDDFKKNNRGEKRDFDKNRGFNKHGDNKKWNDRKSFSKDGDDRKSFKREGDRKSFKRDGDNRRKNFSNEKFDKRQNSDNKKEQKNRIVFDSDSE
ncbi:hypothetical protein P3W45_001111 [Vairimorpha bombi]|jgi:nucleolin